MGDGVETNIGNIGEHREWCSNIRSGLENHWYTDRSKVHFKAGKDKQSKRDSYNDYLKKVVK